MDKSQIDTNHHTPFWKRKNEIRFVIIFLAIYAVFHTIYYQVPDNFFRDIVYHYGIVTVAADAINTVSPSERVMAVQNKLVSTKASLEIVRGCDGAGALFILMAAILAFSSSVKKKMLGLGFAVLLIYTLNQIRIIGLYFVVVNERDWFSPIHTYLAPTLIIVISCIFFAWWALGTTKHSSADEQPQPV